jgi:hypothetical protein
VVHQKEARQFIFLNQPKLLIQPLAYLRSNRPITPYGGFVTKLCQIAFRRASIRYGVVWKGIVKVAGQIQGALLRYFQGVSKGFRTFTKKSPQFRLWSKIKLGVRPAFTVSLLQAFTVTDGYQAVLELVPFPDMIVDVACSHYFDSHFFSQSYQLSVSPGIARRQVMLQFQIIVVAAKPVQVLPD